MRGYLSTRLSRTGLSGGWAEVLIWAAFAWLAIVAVVIVFGHWLAPHDPNVQLPWLGAKPPSEANLLGTDELGRDIVSRLIVGTAPAVIGPLIVALGQNLIGVILGLLAGYFGGRVDTAVRALADLMYSLPSLLIAIVVVGIIDGNYALTIGVLTLLGFAGPLRMIRSEALVEAQKPYIEAGRSQNISGLRIMYRHILPNIAPTVLANFLLDFVAALIAFSSLAFLGLGVAPGAPDWGNMLGQGRSLLFRNPMMAIAPAVLIILTATAATLVGDWLYERYRAGGGR